MGKKKKRLSWLLALLIGIGAPAQAGQVITDADREWARKIADEQALDAVTAPNTLAVLNYRNMTENPQWQNMGQGLAIMITTDLVQSSLSESGKINVIERTRLRALLEEQDLGVTGLMAPESVPRMGRLLAAAYVAGGDLNQGKISELEVDPLLVEVPNDLILDQPQVTGEVADLIRIEKTLLFDILERMEIELTDEEREELAIPITTNLEAWNRFVDGINYSDNGQYSRAAQSYRHALVEDPALNPAREALAELRELGLIAAEGAAPLAGEAVPPPQAPPPSGELGAFGNTALLTSGIVAGLALAIGVPVIVANQSDGGDDGGSSSSQTPITSPSGGGTGDTEDGPGTTPETITPIVTYTTPATGSEISCESGSVRIHFNKAMYTAFGQISPSIGLWGNDGRSLDWAADDRSVAYVWRTTEDACAGFEEAMESTIDFRLYGFRDGEGRFLSGQSTFQYRIGYGGGVTR